MKAASVVAATVLTLAGAGLFAQSAPPFKLGTFERQGRTFVGVVLQETTVIDLAAASAALRNPPASVAMPSDMKDLIARYDFGLRDRIVQVVRSVTAAGAARPVYVYDVKAIKIKPPVMYPTSMLNAAQNYVDHAGEMGRRPDGTQPAGASPVNVGQVPGAMLPGTTSAPGIWERRPDDTRWNPYLFLKSPTSVIAEGEAIKIPAKRTQIDWECELGVVIGKRAKNVAVAQAKDYIFGYTIENDVSDRGGRGDARLGSDWFLQKSHETFGPMGPFIVPKEFVPNIMDIGIKFTLNGMLMQDARTGMMIHDVFEQLSYGSSIMPLLPGDVISTGTPGGVGTARNPPIYLKPGDVSVCTYEGVGTLTNPVVAE